MTANGVSVREQSAEAGLSKAMESLGLASTPCLPNTSPKFNPLDVYRSHLAQVLGPITGIEPTAILPFLHWTQTLDKGDLTLPVAALKLKGKRPDEIAKSITAQVRGTTSRFREAAEPSLIQI